MRPDHWPLGKLDVMRFAALAAVLLTLGLPLLAEAAPAKASKAKPPAKSAEQSRMEGLVAAADQGEAQAQLQLGLTYRDGHGVKADAATALTWFELAASNGSAAAAVEVAKAFEAGRGIRRDPAQAGRWWYLAGTLGDPSARQHWLKLMLDGELQSVGGQQGLDWLAEAASLGDVRAMMLLGEAHEGHMDIVANLDEAERWYLLTARLHGDVEALYRLGRINLHRAAGWRIPSEEEWNPKESERRGRPYGPVWYPAKPALAEDKAVQLRPGIVDATRFLNAAARRGHAEAQFLLGKAMLGGVDLPFDLLDGIIWLEAAAAQGHSEATLMLARFASDGLGLFGRDPVRAYVLYNLAQAMGEEGAAAARDAAAKALSPKQMARARQIVQEFRVLQGM